MTKDAIMLVANETAGNNWMDEAHIQRFAKALIEKSKESIEQTTVPAQQPLTKELQQDVWSKLFGQDTSTLQRPYNSYIPLDSFRVVVRAVEAANGITGEAK